MADVLKENVHSYIKTAKIETVNSYQHPGDSTFEEVWKQCDLFVTTVDNFRLNQALIERATADKKKMIVLDIHNMEVCAYSLLVPETSEKLKAHYLNSKQQLLTERTFTFDQQTLQHPYSPLHCLYWAMALFDSLASNAYHQLESFIKNPQSCVEQFEKTNDVRELGSWLQLELVNLLFDKNYPFNFKDLVSVSIQILKVDLSQLSTGSWTS